MGSESRITAPHVLYVFTYGLQPLQPENHETYDKKNYFKAQMINKWSLSTKVNIFLHKLQKMLSAEFTTSVDLCKIRGGSDDNNNNNNNVDIIILNIQTLAQHFTKPSVKSCEAD